MGKSLIGMNVDTRSLTMAMKVIEKDALPRAVADTLNQTADAVTRQQIRNVKSLFTIRTPYTLKSMTVNRAKPYKALNKAMGKNVNKMFSRVGTYSKYLWLQEENQRVKGRDGGAVPIATLQTRTSKSEKKSIRKMYRLAKSDSLKDGAFGQSGYFRGFIGNPRGQVKGQTRARGLYVRSANNKRLTMLRNMEHRSVQIKGTHFHAKAVEKFGNENVITALFKRAADKYFYKGG